MISKRRFQKNIESFTCAHCTMCVKGDGYTNHCPVCLWSKHVDNNPGDRASRCGGMMEPVGVITRKGNWRIEHRCEACNIVREVRMAKNDAMDTILQITKNATQG